MNSCYKNSAEIMAAAFFTALFAVAPARAARIRACFSPPLPGGCDPLATAIQTIGGARKTVLVQIYALTSRQIVTALVNAKRRGVDVLMCGPSSIGASSVRSAAPPTPSAALPLAACRSSLTPCPG